MITPVGRWLGVLWRDRAPMLRWDGVGVNISTVNWLVLNIETTTFFEFPIIYVRLVMVIIVLVFIKEA